MRGLVNNTPPPSLHRPLDEHSKIQALRKLSALLIAEFAGTHSW